MVDFFRMICLGWTALMNSPSICRKVRQSESSGQLLNFMKNGPEPCVILSANPKSNFPKAFSSPILPVSLKLTNSIFPSECEGQVDGFLSTMCQLRSAFFQISVTPAMQLLMFSASRFWLLWKLLIFLTPSTRSLKLKLKGFPTQSKRPLLLPQKMVCSPQLIFSTNSPRFFTFWRPVMMPIAPQTAKLPSLDVVLLLSNSQPISPSIPKLKQFTKCLVSTFPGINVSSEFQTFSNLPCCYTCTQTYHTSKSYTSALFQSCTSRFNSWKPFSVSSDCSLPQPKFLEKSLPVPRGMMAR